MDKYQHLADVIFKDLLVATEQLQYYRDVEQAQGELSQEQQQAQTRAGDTWDMLARAVRGCKLVKEYNEFVDDVILEEETY